MAEWPREQGQTLPAIDGMPVEGRPARFIPEERLIGHPVPLAFLGFWPIQPKCGSVVWRPSRAQAWNIARANSQRTSETGVGLGADLEKRRSGSRREPGLGPDRIKEGSVNREKKAKIAGSRRILKLLKVCVV